MTPSGGVSNLFLVSDWQLAVRACITFDALEIVWLGTDPAPGSSKVCKLFAPDGCPVPPGNPMTPTVELPRPPYEKGGWPQEAGNKRPRVFSPMLRGASVRTRNLVAKHVLAPADQSLLAREVVLDRNRIEQKNRRQSQQFAANRSIARKFKK